MMKAANLTVVHSDNSMGELPEWFKEDKWLYANLGISGEKADRYISFSFEKIGQPCLKEFAKKYIYYYSSNKSCYSISASVSAIVLFSTYMGEQTDSETINSINEITREHIIGYLAYLSDRKLSTMTKSLRLWSLSNFFNICYEKGWIDYTKKLIYPEDIPRKPRAMPRYIPDFVLNQLNAKLDEAADSDRLISKRRKGHPWTRKELAQYLNDFSNHHEIKDESGQLYRFSFHQFRHTVAPK